MVVWTYGTRLAASIAGGLIAHGGKKYIDSYYRRGSNRSRYRTQKRSKYRRKRMYAKQIYRRSTARFRRKRGRIYGRQRGRMRISGYYGRYNKGRTSELKFHDIATVDAVIASAASILIDSANEIAQGTSESKRIGRKCTIRSIDWRYALRKNAAQTTVGDDVVRVILYLDKQCNGATAAVLDILETDDYQSHYNLANRSRFRFLMDKSFALNSTAGGGDGTTDEAYSWTRVGRYHKRCAIPIEFTSTAGSIAEIRSNNIGILLVSRDGTSQLDGLMRLRFSG